MAVKKEKQYPALSFLTILFGMLYIFAYQFNLPFPAEVFLYGMAISLLMMNFFNGSVTLHGHSFIFLLVAASAFLGIIDTTMFSEGLREAILFTFFACLFIFSYSNKSLVKSFMKWIYLISIVVVLSSIVHFIFPEWFNGIMEGVLREDSFEQFMWSYEVDGAFAGLSAYTPNTTFSAAIVFGVSFLNIAYHNEKPIFKSQLTNLALMALSFFSIMICSKRGIFVATLAGLIVLLFFLYIGKNFIFKFIGCAIIIVVTLVILYRTNEFVASFLNRFLSADFTTGRDLIYKDIITDFLEGNILVGRGTASTLRVSEGGGHNIYLQIVHDHGIIFSIPYFVFLIYNYHIAFEKKCPISIFIQTLFLVYGLTGNPLYSNMFMIIYVYSVLSAVQHSVEKENDDREIEAKV